MANEAPSKEVIDQLRSEHGSIVVVSADDYHVVLAKPDKINIGAVYQRFMEKASDAKSRAQAFAGLFNACVVYPSKEEAAAMLAEMPGLGATFGAHCVELIGLREAEVKKY